ncbi:pyridoxamine-phosphate oxidase [Pyrrhoderma noxium]|uniref:Pyridoxamine-phosphate oxidase n=1 Tax=Pyrrhoderma noxium TaxID=2282107 RepID=A0A286UV40_9AGAM|nr:pyridoxamine-phosphate oxidase [Pyrrhoderma noxium]
MYRHAARRIDTFRCHIWNKWSLQKSNFKIRSITSQNGPGSNEATPDVKPSRVVATAFGLRLIAVPACIVYAVLYHDFGEDDHVFMPVRRWVKAKKESFFTLSPEERQLVDAILGIIIFIYSLSRNEETKFRCRHQ